MASRPKGLYILKVKFEARDDGGLRAYCDDVPGFVLSHRDPKAVLSDVEPALETILSAMYGMPVRVDTASRMGEDDAVAVPPAHVCAASYVGMLQAA